MGLRSPDTLGVLRYVEVEVWQEEAWQEEAWQGEAWQGEAWQGEAWQEEDWQGEDWQETRRKKGLRRLLARPDKMAHPKMEVHEEPIGASLPHCWSTSGVELPHPCGLKEITPKIEQWRTSGRMP